MVTLDEDDPNNIEAYELSVDATESLLIQDVRDLASNVRAGDFCGTERQRPHDSSSCL